MNDRLINSDKQQIVISDIHGHSDALRRLKKNFNYNCQDHQLIYLGDYIDRGPNSLEVVEEIMREVLEEEAIALMGNHERMMLNALAPDTSKKGIRGMLPWLINGGGKTIGSYKKRGKTVMKSHLEYFASLPLYIEDTNYIFVHAGVNPTKKIENQTEQDLLWIRNDFTNATDLSTVTTKTIIFGHTPTILIIGKNEIYFGKNRIGVDTGAGINRRLSAFNP